MARKNLSDLDALTCDNCGLLLGYGGGDLNCCEFRCASCEASVIAGTLRQYRIYTLTCGLESVKVLRETYKDIYTDGIPPPLSPEAHHQVTQSVMTIHSRVDDIPEVIHREIPASWEITASSSVSYEDANRQLQDARERFLADPRLLTIPTTRTVIKL